MLRRSLLLFLATALACPVFADEPVAAPVNQPASVVAATPQQNNGKGPTHTEPPADDPNYSLLGEFVGEMKEAGEASETKILGLQIRPVGGDNFDALSFVGGLPGQEKPGQEKFGGSPMRLIGRRSGDMVILSGGPWALFVSADACVLVDKDGNKLGKLDRVSRTSSTMGAPPPEGAVVLFDGTGVDQFTKGQMTPDGLLMQGADVRPMFQDFNLHVEFRLPYMPEASDQNRANSGLYLQSRYECQVLDSFAMDAVFNGCGSLYRFKQPDVNMCLPPLAWQTYDIVFTAPRWAADGSKIRDAHVTSWVNGVKVQDDVALPSQTGHGQQEQPTLLPIKLQDHGDPVRFRNVWAIDRGLTMVSFPIELTAAEREAIAKKAAEEAAAAAAAATKAEADAKAEAAAALAEAEAKSAETKSAETKTEEPAPEAVE